jgi:hypothetical protein
MRKKTFTKFTTLTATGALLIGLTACTASGGTSDVEQSGGSDTSIDISPTISGDEKLDLGNIDTGNNNSTDGNGNG